MCMRVRNVMCVRTKVCPVLYDSVCVMFSCSWPGGTTTALVLCSSNADVRSQNGSGKTTLLDRINRGLVQNFPSHMSTLLVRQEVVGDDSSALQAVQEGNAELVQYKAEEKLLLEMSDQGITYDEDCGMRVDEMLNEVCFAVRAQPQLCWFVMVSRRRG